MQKHVQIFQYLSSNMLFFPRFVARSKFFSFQARGISMSFDRPFQGNAEGRIIVYGSLGVLAVATLQCCLFFFEACSWSKALGFFLLLDLHRISFDTFRFFVCISLLLQRLHGRVESKVSQEKNPSHLVGRHPGQRASSMCKFELRLERSVVPVPFLETTPLL